MRVVSWNCSDRFQDKFDHLQLLHPDIAVIQEVRVDCLQRIAPHDCWKWAGDPGQKGLAVISFGDWKISSAPLAIDERWFIPVCATGGAERINIVAAWIDSAKDCTPPTLRALDKLEGFLRDAPSIVAGDLNQSVSLDKGRSIGRRFADVLDVLEARGMVSAWHSFHKEKHGQETSATLHWRWKEDSKYHIDFVFGSSDLRAKEVSIGAFEQYTAAKISDHVPLTVDYDIKMP